MAQNPIQRRRQRYFQLNSQIAQWDNARLRSLFDAGEAQTGWGRNKTLEIGGHRVFVKRIPVTDREYDNLFATRNLYDLPPHYNYGVGSAGLGVFRELVAHIKTTNWVLDGRIETFPLMYHYRIVASSGERTGVDPERHQEYADYWGGNANIGRYILDRADANHELLLFLEHFPHVLHPWLQANLDRVSPILDDLRATLAFLRKNGIIHFDAHFHNILTDGERPYLTDFGLVLDRNFDLTEAEKAFFKANTHYDYGEALSCLGSVLYNAYEELPESAKLRINTTCGMTEDLPRHERRSLFLNHIEKIHADGVMKLDRRTVACVVKYRSIIALMNAFFWDMGRNHKKDTPFRNAELKRRLNETGFL